MWKIFERGGDMSKCHNSNLPKGADAEDTEEGYYFRVKLVFIINLFL
jgi:hypothetical protein